MNRAPTLPPRRPLNDTSKSVRERGTPARTTHIWMDRGRAGHQEWASTLGWEHLAACRGDDRFIQRELPETTVAELIAICRTCPVMQRCLLWAQAQTQPVGFVVAGGQRWKAWNHCSICGKKVRGVDRCPAHAEVGEPIGTICADGQGHPFRITDNH